MIDFGVLAKRPFVKRLRREYFVGRPSKSGLQLIEGGNWMKHPVFAFLLVLILGGCAANRYNDMDEMVRNKEYNQAIRAYIKELDPHVRDGKRYIFYNRESIARIGQVYWHMNRYEPAIKILKMITQKEPDFGMAYFYLGLCYEGLEKYDKAIEAYNHYENLSLNDAYRAVLKGRRDWAVRYLADREIQEGLKNEAFANVDQIPPRNLAVLPFIYLGQDREWEPLQKGLTEMLITDLSKVKELHVLDRIYMSTLAEAIRTTNTKYVENMETERLAKILDVRSFIKGSYLVMDDMRITLDVSVQTADQSYKPEPISFDGNLVRLFMMEKEILFKTLEYFNITLDVQKREELLQVPTENLEAFMAYCRGLDAMDQYDYARAQTYFKQAVVLDNQFTLAAEWVIEQKLWELTHNQNTKRVHYEITQFVKTNSRGKGKMIYEAPPELLSTYNRLQWMGLQQNASMLPSSDNRKAPLELSGQNISLIPEMLAPPPMPVVKPSSN